jgi:two-component system phosphate regulon sensor histidine kinase PhoR
VGDLHDVKGYGLGLSYVKQLIDTIKGDIKVKSKPGTGTIFTIKFPQSNG